MNILIYNGGTSSHTTKKVAHEFVEICKSHNHNVVLLEDTFEDCKACHYCWKNIKCCIEDSLNEVLSANKWDAIVIATPLYFFNMSAKAKSFLDRLYSIDLVNMIFSLLAVGGSPSDVKEHSGLDLVVEILERTANYCGSYLTDSIFFKLTEDEFDVPIEDTDRDTMNNIVTEMEKIYSEIQKA